MITGVLPIMVAEGRHGQVFNSLPFYGSNGGILARGPNAGEVLARWYSEQLADPGVAAATVIENPVLADPTPLPHDVIDSRVGHITHFGSEGSTSEEWLLHAIDSSARRNLRKAQASAVEVDVENHSLADLEILHRESMAVAGGRAKSSLFFDAIPKHFRAGIDYRIYLARVGGKPAAALLLFYYGRTVEYYVPAVRPELRHLQPTAALLYRAMSDAMSDGFRHWNWGGSWPGQDTLMRFKAKWGGVAHVYRYWTKVGRTEIMSVPEQELLEEYRDFFVVPFSALNGYAEGMRS